MHHHSIARKPRLQPIVCKSCQVIFTPKRGRITYCSTECGRQGRIGGFQPALGVWQFKCGHSARLPREGESNELAIWKLCGNTIRGGTWICRVCVKQKAFLVTNGFGPEGLIGRIKSVLSASRGHAKRSNHAPISDSAQDIVNIWLSQDNKCKACGIVIEFKGRTVHVDHCHTTGKVRGIICRSCNWVEGIFRKMTTAQRNGLLSYIELFDS